LAVALPPSIDLNPSRATCTSQLAEEEVIFADRATITLPQQAADTEIERSNSVGSSYSWRSDRAVIGVHQPVQRARGRDPDRRPPPPSACAEPDTDRRPPPPSALAAHEAVVLRGINSKTRPVSSYNKDAPGVKPGLAQKLVGRFTRLDISGVEK
jgi:hypothetical protein